MASRRRSKKIGLSPGSLVYLGDKKDEPIRITVIDYGGEHYHQETVAALEECVPYTAADSVTWINVSGIHDITAIGALGDAFNIHPLVLEDVVNTEHRPKLDDMV